MKLIFFGTSGGIPTKDRNVTAIGLQRSSKAWSLFDCGDGTTFQIARAEWDFSSLDSVFITHLHADHFFGILSLLFRKDMMYPEDNLDLTLYAPTGVKAFIEATLAITKKVFVNFKLTIVEIEKGMQFEYKELRGNVVAMEHAIPSYGYCLEVEGKRIVIAGDNEAPKLFGEQLRNVDLFVHEATFMHDDYVERKRRSKHTTAKLLGEVASKYGVKNLIATHISWTNQDEEGLKGLYDEIALNYQSTLFIADDFDLFSIDEKVHYLGM